MKKYVVLLFLALAVGSSVAQASGVVSNNDRLNTSQCSNNHAETHAEPVCYICYEQNNLIALHGCAVGSDGAHTFHESCLTRWTYKIPHRTYNKCPACQEVLGGADAQYLPTRLELPLGFIMPVGDISTDEQLHIAILGNCPIRTRHALEAGANVNTSDNVGFTPLHTAALYGHLRVVPVLLGADDINVNAVDSRGRTALQIAEGYNHPDVVNAIRGWINNHPSQSNSNCVIQ